MTLFSLNSFRAGAAVFSLSFLTSGFGQQATPEMLDLGNTEALTLSSALQLAFTNNLDIQIGSLVPGIYDDRYQAANGNFDPEFEMSVRGEDLATAQSTQEFVSTGGSTFELDETDPEARIFDENNIRSEMQLIGKFTSGTEYELGLRANQLENDLTRDNATALFETEYKTFAGIVLTQPLLKDFGPGVNKSKLTVAAIDQRISQWKFRQRVEEILVEISLDYFDQLMAYQAFRGARKELEIAEATVETLQDQLERGALSQAEIRAARTEYVYTVERMLLARQTLFLKNTDLQAGIRQDADFADLPLIVPEPSMLLVAPEQDFAGLATDALKMNPAYKMAAEKIEKMNVELRYHKNQKLPRLDLEATFGYNGIDEDYGGSFGETFGGQGHEYAVGLVLKVPLGNNEAKGRMGETEKMLQQALLELKQIEQELYHEIQRSLTSVKVSQMRMSATAESRKNAESNLEAAKSALEKGIGSELLVMELEYDLLQSMMRELASRVDQQRSLLELYQQTGTLLEHAGIEMERPE